MTSGWVRAHNAKPMLLCEAADRLNLRNVCAGSAGTISGKTKQDMSTSRKICDFVILPRP
jgi:hypothetical protein